MMYILYAINVRSFEKIKDQVVEVSNEVVFFFLILLLIQFYSESEWTNFTVNFYIGIILSQLLILLMVPIAIAMIRFLARYNFEDFKKKFKKKKHSKATKELNPISVHENFDQNRPKTLHGSHSNVKNKRKRQDSIEVDKKEAKKFDNYTIM